MEAFGESLIVEVLLKAFVESAQCIPGQLFLASQMRQAMLHDIGSSAFYPAAAAVLTLVE
jgi:hypothetical protein